MKLLDLGVQRASLEFSAAERDAVIGQLRACGEVTINHGACHDVLLVAGEELIYLDEWDEPCLIAGTASGVDMLARIAADAQATAPVALRR